MIAFGQNVEKNEDLSEDADTKGFDLQAGQSWIYPTNYSHRDYQFNIIQEALFKNTLVSLPTGLGKTFIAAVVMYNFYRWYPHNKIIFMAPTRPLVKQQMDACYNIMAIPQSVTAELTGTKIQQSRTAIWQEKRVFFITPQVLQNDLAIIIELGAQIKCLVFDEAHRAKGNHAYCEIIRKLLPKNKLFRVLALSATPGNSSKDVIEVMQNLLIAHVEFRSEESEDVKTYVFERALETVVVPLGEKLQQIKEEYLRILEKYTRTLIQYKVIYGNCCNLTKGKIFMIMKEFQARNASNRMPNYGEIMKNLNICVTLYHAYETLIRCGLRAFLNFYEEHINNPLLSGNVTLRQILEDLRNYLGPAAEVRSLPDGTFAQISSETKFGHPKFYKLQDILITHFQNSETSARVIVFFEYRESASEAYALLTQNYPLIKPRVFVGQGSGNTQKDQINTVRAFREGTCNVLLSTCIGEEGLDVGDVDLIVCFDIANKSPIRMIQRMGRTGRKKEGRVIILVTEGKEQQTLKDCLIYKNNLGNFITNTACLEEGKYNNNPRMVPSFVQPKCQKIFITVKKTSYVSKRTNDIRFDDDNMEKIEIEERIKSKIENFFDKVEPLSFEPEDSKISFNRFLEKQRAFQDNCLIKHSQNTEIFVSLLKFADSKRFNIPVTQIGKPNSFSQNRLMKQSDIRNLFARPQSTNLTQENPESSANNNDKEKTCADSFPAKLFEEIIAFNAITETKSSDCQTCDFLFECPSIYNEKTEKVVEKIDVNSWIIPDLTDIDSITLEDLKMFADSLNPKSKDIYEDMLDIDNDMFEDFTLNQEKSSVYETPRNFDKILKSFRVTENDVDIKLQEKSFKYETPKNFDKVLNLMKNVEVIPEVEEMSEDVKSSILSFFKLSSIDDIFIKNEDLDATVVYTTDMSQPREIVAKSPDLFSSSEDQQIANTPESPILSSFQHSQIFKAKKLQVTKPNLANLKLQHKSFIESPKNTKDETKSIDFDISDICDLSIFGITETKDVNTKTKELDDFCDVSKFFNSFEQKNECGSSQKENATIQANKQKSPKKGSSKLSQTSNKPVTQFSISQMLSLIEKTEKEDAFTCQEKNKPKRNILQLKKKTQSPNVTQSNKKTIPSNMKKKKFNLSLSTNSDDEFEEVQNSPIFMKPKPVKGFSESKKRKRLFSDFIDNEAEVSNDDENSEDEESGDDYFEASFVADETQNFNNTTMHAKYLESIKSPARGRFKIPQKFKHNISNVFSQKVSNEDNTYVNDSFCVESDDEIDNTDVSELEILEKKLLEMKKKRKNKSEGKVRTKRRRLIQLNSDSD